MNSRFASPILAVLSLSVAACEKGKPVVILDAWWTEDYAEQGKGCKQEPENPACATARRVVKDFETELITEIAADERSKEFTFLVFYGSANTSKKALPAITKALTKPHWMLGIDFIPGEAKQNWWLGPPVGPYFGGKADAKEIARKICSIVRSQTSSAIATSNSARPAARAPALDLPELVKKHRTAPSYRSAQSIKQGFESEEDCFASDVTLVRWTRDARHWATQMLHGEPEVSQELFHEAGNNALDRSRKFYREQLGSDPAAVDSLDVTGALMNWANQRRGPQYSRYRAKRWEFVVEIADAALWLGRLFPNSVRHV